MKYRFLSYLLEDKVPAYGKIDSVKIKNIKSIANGDSANMHEFLMGNHCGTHVDSPNHFFQKGAKITDYAADFWLFRNPQVIRFKLLPSDIVLLEGWVKDIRRDCDMLFFYSRWSKLRSKNIYMNNNPGIHPEVGFYLREKHPNLKAIGIDWVSVSPYRDRKLGRRSHRAPGFFRSKRRKQTHTYC